MYVSYTLDDIRRAFDMGTYQRGFDYARSGCVFSLDRGQDGALVALVQGSGWKPYRVRARPIDSPGGTTLFDTSCTCPVGVKCKHAVAVLVQGVGMQPKSQVREVAQAYRDGIEETRYRETLGPAGSAPAPALDYATEQWLREVERSSQPPGTYPPGVSKRIVYLLSVMPGQRDPQLSAVTVAPKADGSFGGGKRFPIQQAFGRKPPLYVIDEDRAVMRVMQRHMGYVPVHGDVPVPCNEDTALLLEMVLATGRCYWQAAHPDHGPLRWADERAATLEWQVEADGRQHLVAQVQGESLPVLRWLPPCYVDAARRAVGPLAFDGVSPRLAGALVAAPPVRPEQAAAVSLRLAPALRSIPKLLPKGFAPRREEGIAPRPCLTLTAASIRPYGGRPWDNRWNYYTPVEVATAQLAFDYGGLRVDQGERAQELTFYRDGGLVTVTRDVPAERRALKELRQRGFGMQLQDAAKHLAVEERYRGHFSLGEPTPDFHRQGEFADRWVEFVTRGVPQLAPRAGPWRSAKASPSTPCWPATTGMPRSGRVAASTGLPWSWV